MAVAAWWGEEGSFLARGSHGYPNTTRSAAGPVLSALGFGASLLILNVQTPREAEQGSGSRSGHTA